LDGSGADARNPIVFQGSGSLLISERMSMTKITVSVAAFSLVLLPMTVPALAEGDAALGQKAFQRCSACHSTTEQQKAGPGLSGIIGRAAGSVDGVRYSAAMKESGLVWDEATLDRFLAAPRDVVPKTTMTVSVPKPEDRQNIIAYLKSLSQ
jgi:cytochrome c